MKAWYDLDWAGAERAFQTAITLDGSHLTSLLWRSLYLSAVGRHEEALASVTRAREADPLSQVVNLYLGVAQGHAGMHDVAIRQIKQAIELDRHQYRPYMFLGRAYAAVGRYDDGIASFRQALSLNPENIESTAYMGQTMAEQGDRKGALTMLKKVKAAGKRTGTAQLAAAIYSSLEDEEEMMRSLEEALKKKCAPLYIILLDYSFRRYYSVPRFQEFLRRIGLPAPAAA
jgi:tetratricopeptide (TPR) repeat protein